MTLRETQPSVETCTKAMKHCLDAITVAPIGSAEIRTDTLSTPKLDRDGTSSLSAVLSVRDRALPELVLSNFGIGHRGFMS
jgi:hypothetical protein